MILPPGYAFGEVRGGLGLWCIHKDGERRMLCGQDVYQIPAPEFQPDPDLDEVHDGCLRWLQVIVAVSRGDCPVCGDRVPLVDGRIGPHGGGCVGVNMAPKRGRR